MCRKNYWNAVTLCAILFLGISLSACCGHASRNARQLDESSYPWVLKPVSGWSRDILLKQHVVARSRGLEHGFDAALQKRGDALILVGLTPFGTRAFALEQHGDRMTFRTFVDREIPFPPRFMLIDIQRAYFVLQSELAAPEDGVIEYTCDGERVSETRVAGQLVERRFERIDGSPPGRIIVTYADWRDGTPMTVTLDNGWFGYVMEVTTTDATLL